MKTILQVRVGTDKMIDAVVLAGGGKPEPLTEQEGVSNKAFIKLHNKPIIAYILDALHQAGSIDRIIVVGPPKELEDLNEKDFFDIVAEQGSMLDNLAAGFELADTEKPCLVVTGDIPLINAEVIDQFLELCNPLEHDLYYPVLTREACLERFPETERTYVRLKEGHVTGGNIGLVRPAWFLDNKDRLEMFISYRKKPLKLLRILPISLGIKYLLKTLSIKDLEYHLSRLLFLKAKAVICDCVEIAVDVDKISDLEMVKKAIM